MTATGHKSFDMIDRGRQTSAMGRAMGGLTRTFLLLVTFAVLLVSATSANALVCTSVATGNWGVAATWTSVGNCNRVPTAADDVTIVAGHTITLAAAPPASVLSLTLSSPTSILATGGNNLTVTGDIAIDGTISGTGRIYSVGPALVPITISGTGTFNGVRLYTSGTGGTTIPAGSNINFLGNSRLYAGNNGGGTSAGSLTVNGTITAASTVSLRTYTGTAAAPGFIIGPGGALNATGATFAVRAGAALTNNGSITIGSITGANTTTSIMTNAANSTLNVSTVGSALMATGVLTATAAGNTINYSGAGAQTLKSTIYNNLTLSGSGVKTTATVTVNGILSMEGTATASVAPTYGAAATLKYNTATARVAGVEWITPFAGTGGVIIANVGAITMNSAEVFNASVPLTINAGATLATANFGLTFGGNFVNNGGTFTAGSSPIVITNTMAAQSIAGFTTTGLVSMTKTAGTATFTGNVNGAGLTINGAGGTLNLGTGLTHTFTGAWTRTNGTLIGGSSTLNVGGSCSGAGGTFTAGTGTVNWNAAGAQTVCQYAYNNLILSNSGAKTMTGVTAITGDLSITGAATMTSNAAFTAGGALNYSSTGATTLVAPIVIGSFNQTAGTFSAGANAITVSGNWNETGTFNPGTGTVTLNGATAQTISGTSPVNFNNLTVTNAASPNITLATNVTVATLTGTVTLTSSCPDFTLTSTTPAQTLHSCSAVNTITRLDPTPTSASTVRWAVNFSNSVTGVATTNFALVVSGVSGASIVSVSGSGTSWTVTANTGVGAGSLGLNMTSSAGVSPAPTNLPFVGEVYTITVPSALADYRLDEGSWNGTANEVKDSSVTALHGTAMLGAVPAAGKICNAGNFAANYVNVVDNPSLDITNNLTVSVWIKPTRCGGAPGKDALMSFYSKDDNYEAHVTSTCNINWWWGTGNITSAATVPTNAWTHVAMVYVDGSQTLYINGVADATGTFAGLLPTNAMPFQIANDQEFGGGTRRFDGMIDELKIFNSALSAAKIFAGYTNENAGKNWDGTARACPSYGPDHLEIQHASGSGITCAVSTITVKACTDSAVPCVTPYTGGVSGTLTATGTPTVNWDGTTGGAAGAGFVIPNGSSSVTKDVHVTTVGNVVFGVSSASPTPSKANTCNFGSPSCTFTTSDTGLLFGSVANHVSETLQSITVSAVKKANNSLACVPAFGGVSKDVTFTCGYITPNSGTLPVRVGGAALNAGNSAAAACDATGQTLNLAFNASGVASTTVQYADVGDMTLVAQHTGSGKSAGLVMSGSTSFIAAPASFAFSAITAAPIKAGATFNATITALNSINNPTPNFLNQTVTITSTNPLPGIGNATAINTALTGFASGAATASLVWKEVGTIDLKADLADYMTSGIAVTGTQANVGRFQPAYFDTAVTAGCGTFTYSGSTVPAKAGQPFTVTATAKETGGGITKNYAGANAYLTTLSNADVTIGLASHTIAAAGFANGVGSANVTYAVAVPETVPLTLAMRATDADPTPVSSSGHTEGAAAIRSGRAKLGNAHGSELLNLPIPFRTEYWNSNGWVTNSADTCSGDGALGGGVSVVLSASPVTCVHDNGNPGRSGAGCAAGGPVGHRFMEGGVTGFSGVFNLWLKAPGSGNTGAVTVTGSVPSWLQYPWSGSAASNPEGLATFGVYKGNNEFIYLRESY